MFAQNTDAAQHLLSLLYPSIQGGSGARHRHVMASFPTPLHPRHVDPVAGVPRAHSRGAGPAVPHGSPGRRRRLDPRRCPDRLPVADARLAVAGARPALPRRRAHPGPRRGQLRAHHLRPRPRLARVGPRRRGRCRAGSRDAGVLPVADRRRQPHPPPAERHRGVAAGQRRGRAGGPAHRPRTRDLADQRRVRHLRVGRAQHRLHVRRQRLRDAPGPAPATHRGDPDPALRRLRPAAGHRHLARRGVRLRRPAPDLDRAAPRGLGGPDDGSVDLGRLQPDRHARGGPRPDHHGGLGSSQRLRPAQHRDAGLPDDGLRVRGPAALPGPGPARLPGQRGGAPTPGGDGPGRSAGHRLRVDQRGAGAHGHLGRRTAPQRGRRARSWAATSSPPSPRDGCAGWSSRPRSPTASTGTGPRTDSGSSPYSSRG